MQRWLDAYAECRGVPQASKAVGVDRGTPHKARKVDQVFAAAWDAIDHQITGELEKAAICRAIDGWLEPVFYQGEQCGEVRKYSNALAIFLLKCRRPSVYNIAPGQTGSEASAQDRAREIREFISLMDKSVGDDESSTSERTEGANASSA